MNKSEPEGAAGGSGASRIVWIVLLALLALAYLGLLGGGIVATIVVFLVLVGVFFLIGRACAYHPRQELQQPEDGR